MEDELIQILSAFGYPVIRQGSLPDGAAYPDTFFTFWNRYEDGHSFYDNDTASVTWSFDVNAYSASPSRAYDLLAQARASLKAGGWIIGTRGYDVPSDEITHIGRGMSVQYLGAPGAVPEPETPAEPEPQAEPKTTTRRRKK